MKTDRKIVLLSVIVLFLVWLGSNLGRILGGQDGTIRFVLGSLFSLLILLRRKPARDDAGAAGWVIPGCGLVGAALAVSGMVIGVKQFEWLGVVLLFYACLRWALPERFSRDILSALFVLYWIHPLPGQIFGKLQLAMQLVSVKGAEWLLHCANARVWADGFLLHTGFRTFGVPESCSGMRTGVTVSLCVFGASLLFRFKWYETALFLFLGAAQVLILNILRIAHLVFWSSRMPAEWGATLLHDTLGVFLLISLLLTQAELSWWRIWKSGRDRRNAAIARGERERPDVARKLPAFWRMAYRLRWAVVGFMLLAAGTAFAVYKSRPAHRAAMIYGVIDGLLASDPDTAEKAITRLLARKPDDRDLLAKRVRALVMRKKFEEALAELEKLSGGMDTLDLVLKSWALMALGRTDEAFAVVESLPEQAKKLPAVAIVRAEYAAIQGDPENVSKNVIIAAGSDALLERVRALYPYLAGHEQWRAIAESAGGDMPFESPDQALIAIQANLKVNNAAGAARLLKRAVAAWPDDARFLNGLFSVAVTGNREYEDIFARKVSASVENLDVDRLAACISDCFRLNRPDLAWPAYLRLERIDPKEPALHFLPARYADVWFTFRRHQLGIEAASKYGTMDLRSVYLLTRDTPPFKSFWARVPLADEMAAGYAKDIRARHLNLCVDELARREKTGELSQRLQVMYPAVLALADRYDEAHARLDSLESMYPERKGEFYFQHAVLYNRQGQWQRSYEALRKYRAEIDAPNAAASLMLVGALMNLDLGVCAMEVSERVLELLPGMPQIVAIIASIWDTFGFKEEALFVLSNNKEERESRAVAQLLYDTGRFIEADQMARTLGIRIVRNPDGERQPILLEPAEMSVARRWPAPMSEGEMDERAAKLTAAADRAASPFIRDLWRLMAGWYERRGQGGLSNADKWRDIGRDDMERAAALNQLTMLLARQKEYGAAAKAAEQALELLPRSTMLWRILIALNAGAPEVVGKARQASPNDPEIWLASVVTAQAGKKEMEWAEEMKSVAADGKFSVGAMVRAGDYLLRKNIIEAADILAWSAVERCRGLLPAYVLGLRCAVEKKDADRVLACSMGSVKHALDPAPFHKIFVYAKSMGETADADMVAGLEYLRERFPKESEWDERLGKVFFYKGDLKHAMSVLEPAIGEDIGGVKLESLLLAAETARLDGEHEKAIDLLEKAYAIYPDRLSVLNNLVYNLAQKEATVARALEMLPKLLQMGGEKFVVLDTAALVYLRNGQLEKAAGYMERAVGALKEDDYSTLESKLNAAEIQFRLGNYEQAKGKLEAIRRSPGLSDLVDMKARELLREIEKKSRGAAGPRDFG